MYCTHCGTELPETAKSCDKCGKSVQQNQLEHLQIEITKLLEHLRTEMASYVVPTALQNRLSNELVEIEHLLVKSPTNADIQVARDKANQCKWLWQIVTSQAVLAGHTNNVKIATFNPDGTILASCCVVTDTHRDTTIRLWDMTGGYEQTMLNESDVLDRRDSVDGLAFSPDGAILASYSFKTIMLWNVASGYEQAVMEGHNDLIQGIAFSSDGTILVSYSQSKYLGFGDSEAPRPLTIRLWDVTTGRELAVLKKQHSYLSPRNNFALSPTGTILATHTIDGFTPFGDKVIYLWDVVHGRKHAMLEGHKDTVDDITFSPDGTILASHAITDAYNDTTIRLWNVADGCELAVLKGGDYVSDIAFNPDGTILASSHTEGIWLWDVISKHKRTAFLKEYTDFWGGDIVFSPNGAMILAIYSAKGDSDINIIQLWDVSSERLIWERWYTTSVWGITFNPDGTILAFRSDDDTVRLLDVVSGYELGVLKGRKNFTFSSDGTMLVAWSRDDKTISVCGGVIHKDDWEQNKKEQKKRERTIQEEQQRQRRANGRCEICGVKMGFFDKLGRQTRCKNHR